MSTDASPATLLVMALVADPELPPVPLEPEPELPEPVEPPLVLPVPELALPTLLLPLPTDPSGLPFTGSVAVDPQA